jgi:lantibiotic modifying enzyme
VQYQGGAHGFAGNVHALARAAPHLGAGEREALFRRAAQTAVQTAMVEDGAANWPPVAGEIPGRRTDWLVQWCHGAPGVVVGLSGIPAGLDPRLDHLLVAGGELTWRAGPLEKGPGLCHGTAGNGYALLKIYRRTGEARWLDRARAFAMHAILQWERHLARYRRGRYGVWTGDLGLALYLVDCIRGEDAFPTLDVL